MTETEINELTQKQRNFFNTGKTLPVSFRKNSLQILKKAVIKYEKEIEEALFSDLGKSRFESYMCETGMVLSEISYMIKNISKFARKKRVKTPLAQFHSRSFKKPSPRGVTLIMSPWNYPFMLALDPLVDSVAAGNTVVLKPSAYSPATSEVIRKMIEEFFEPEYIAVVTGGRAENSFLSKAEFNHIFFTGSVNVGKEIMKNASARLASVTLELGGKSPCLVLEDADIKLAAKRIVFGKFLNCGQTCVAPDYIFCDRKIKDSLITEIKKQIELQFGKAPLSEKDYGKIINKKHFERILGLIDEKKVVHGGKSDPDSLKIEPTVMTDVTFDDAVMGEEIFGPVLPVLEFGDLNDAVAEIQKKPSPLAFYIFTKNTKKAESVIEKCAFGGGCINDTIIHLATSEMGFGGFGESGTGSYHGKDGFIAFSHIKSIVDKKTWLDLPMRYKPYKKFNEKLLRIFLK